MHDIGICVLIGWVCAWPYCFISMAVEKSWCGVWFGDFSRIFVPLMSLVGIVAGLVFGIVL